LIGELLPCFLIVPVGAFAVFMLEYGVHFDFVFSLSGVPLLDEPSLAPTFSYAWNGLRNVPFVLTLALLLTGGMGDMFREIGAG